MPTAGKFRLPAAQSRIPSLDGLRALSIALVLFAHTAGTRFFPSFVDARRDLGNLGVRVFFVISGFLITTLLLSELKDTRTISLKWFYIRRALRIFPAAYAYLGAMLVATAVGWIALGRGDFLHAITYTVNYERIRPWPIIHLWSLSVEEQFYLLWPAVLLLAGARRGLRIAASILVLAPVLRVVTYFGVPSLAWTVGASFQTNADALAAGCVLAGIRPRLDACPAYLRVISSKWFAAAPLVVLFLVRLFQHLVFSLSIGITLLNLAIAVIIDRSVRFPSDTAGRFLNWRPMVYLGVLSYSIYLWQEPFLDRLSSAPVCWFPLNLICVAAAAWLSYTFVETPCLNWRRRLERRFSPRRTHATAVGSADSEMVTGR